VSVHIDELHSEVVSSGERLPEPRDPWKAEEDWREFQREAERLAARVRAAGFDD